MREKEPDAFRTIGELSDEIGVAQHILRYWEEKFPQLKPLKRAGNRRYYRPGDVAVARRIHALLHEEGFTIKGAQKALRDEGRPLPDRAAEGVDLGKLKAIRDRLARALDD